MRHRPRLRALLALTLALTLAAAGLTACGGQQVNASWHGAPRSSTMDQSAALPPTPSPANPFAVGVRRVDLARGAARPLPTTVWYPAAGTAKAGTAREGAAPAAGRFPLVVFSHGLTGLPQYYTPLTTRWAAAGFVVAGPAYPHTNRDAPKLDFTDVGNQPADASYVITQLLARDAALIDPARIDPARIGAAGHSAGGFTTVGMFTGNRDRRLRGGVVIAGGQLGSAYAGSAAPLLFVHGDKDPTVSYATGRVAYDRSPWPKAFLTLLGQDHGAFLGQGAELFEAIVAITTDFLRWSLYGDAAARSRLVTNGTVDGVSRLESTL